MAAIITHGVQFFVATKRGLAQGRYVECKGPEDACKRAEEGVRLGKAAGAAAFTRTCADREYDDGQEPVTLATFGRVPPGVRDQLPF